jgi:aminopeptidase N
MTLILMGYAAPTTAALAYSQTFNRPTFQPVTPSPNLQLFNRPTFQPVSYSPHITPTYNILPPPTLFEAAWDDPTPFYSGLITETQAVLNQLPGATVYHLDIQLSDDLTSLQGHQEVRYTNRENHPLSEIYFRLFPNLADGAAAITGVRLNGRPVEPIYEQQNSAVRLPLSSPLLPGQAVVIQLDFAVQIPTAESGNYGTFGLSEGVLALAHFYPLIPAYDDEGWNIEIAPDIGDVVYADASLYLVRFTAPLTLTLATSGVDIESERANGRQVVTVAAGPMRDFYLAASDRFTVTSRVISQTVIHSYAPTEYAAGNEAALESAARAWQSFNDRFGPYPFTELDLVSTSTFALGVEYPGIVAILMQLYDPAGQVRGAATGPLLKGVVAHEVAHQWFYSQVGNDQVDEPWLDEALAQYATLLYYQDVYGADGAAGFRRSLERRWQRVDRADIPIGLPVRDYDETGYGAIVYGRGPLFIEELAQTMGQETFNAFLRDYYQTFNWRIATGAEFKVLAERHCTCDLTAMFEAWVYPKTAQN